MTENVPEPQAQPSEATCADLNAGEVEWVKINLDWLTESGWDGTAQRLAELHDQLVAVWHAAPELDRPDPNDLVNALGIGLGDLLARETGLRWQVYSDGEGSDLAVHGGPAGITLFPVATVARHFTEQQVGWVEDFVAQAVGKVVEINESVRP